MRRPGTLLVVGAVGVLALTAAADSLRRPEEQRRLAEMEAVERPRAPAARGVLVYVDDTCRGHAVRLPGGEAVHGVFARGCRSSLWRSAVWQPRGILVARCRHGRVEVLVPRRRVSFTREGCAPAWRPDGTLTYVRDGELVQSTVPRGRRVLLSREDVARAVDGVLIGPRAGNEFRAVAAYGQLPGATRSLKEVAWLDDERLAAIVRIQAPGHDPLDFLVVFRGRVRVGPPPLFGERLWGLEANPRGDGVAVFRAARGAPSVAVVYTMGTSAVMTFRGARAFEWSPDGRFGAVALADRVYVFARRRPLRLDTLPIVARDLAWR